MMVMTTTAKVLVTTHTDSRWSWNFVVFDDDAVVVVGEGILWVDETVETQLRIIAATVQVFIL